MMLGEPLMLGPMIVSRIVAARSDGYHSHSDTGGGGGGGGDFVAIYFPHADCRGRDIILADGRLPVPALGSASGIALLAPRRYLAEVLTHDLSPGRVAGTRSLRMIQRYLAGLLALDRRTLSSRQADLAASAIRSLLGAAFLQAEAARGLASRRRATLLDRVVGHIDDHLGDPLTAEALCMALGCSRSALYRTTAAAGGVVELVYTRRLLAIRDVLRRPDEKRTIGAIARAHGFANIPQFHRRFKTMFGMPPGRMRMVTERAIRYTTPPPPTRH